MNQSFKKWVGIGAVSLFELLPQPHSKLGHFLVFVTAKTLEYQCHQNAVRRLLVHYSQTAVLGSCSTLRSP